MQAERLGDLRADGAQRVERRHRLLEHHRDPPPAQVAERVLAGVDQVDAVEGEASGAVARAPAAGP